MEQLELTAEKFSFVFTELKSNSNETLFEFKFNQQGLDLISGVERKIYIFKRLIPIFYYQQTLPIIKDNKILDYCFLVLNPNHICGYVRLNNNLLNLTFKDCDDNLIAKATLTFQECIKWKKQTEIFLGDNYKSIKSESENFLNLKFNNP